MRRVLLLLALSVLSGCATTGTVQPRSLHDMLVLQVRERAGAYPGDWAVEGDSHTAQFNALQRWAGAEGVVVTAAPIANKQLLGHSSYGAFTGWVVLINDTLPINNRLYTLVHELAHVYGPQKVNTAEAEVIAEMVSATVCARLGLDVWPQTAAYLATFVSLDTQLATVSRYGEQIDAMVERFARAAGKP